MAAKVGVTNGITLIFKVVFVAHCPPDGVKVYTPVPALKVLTAGAHAPLIAFVELVGKTGAMLF